MISPQVCRQIGLTLGRSSFAFFFQNILGYKHAPYLTNWHHYEWFDLLTKKQLRFLVIECSRDHAKTTCICRAFPMWRVANNPYELGVMATGDEDLGKLSLSVIKEWATTNPYLSHLKGDKLWSASHALFSNNAEIIVKGFGANPRGISKLHRPMWVVNDDIYSDRNTYSMDYIEHFFFDTILPMVDPKWGKVILVGTPKSTEDLFQKLRSNKEWLFRSYPAIDTRYQSINNTQTLWPDRYTFEELMRIKDRIGELAFAREYLCRPINPHGQQLRTEWLRYWRNNHGRIDHWDEVEKVWDPTEIRESELLIYQGVDPVRGSKDTKRADYFAIATIGWHKKSRTAYLIDIYRKKVTLPEQIQIIDRYYRTFHPITVYVESNLYKEIGQWLRELTDIPFRTVDSIKDKVARIQQLGCHFEQGRIYIKQDMALFKLEYAAFDGMQTEHDDMLDALNMAMLAIPKMQTFLPVAR